MGDKMDENRLDEDFLFFLGLARSSIKSVQAEVDADKCQQWLNKLCGESFRGLRAKRNRNIYLSNLVLCMNDEMLSGPFLNYPNDDDLSNAPVIFSPQTEPLEENVNLSNTEMAPSDLKHTSGDGRTYLATRVLPDGSGAFGYLAVSVGDGDQQWYNDGAVNEAGDLSAQYKMAMKGRPSRVDREKILTFYDGLMENIREELDGLTVPKSNEQINRLLVKLEACLREKNKFNEYANLNGMNVRTELLLMLYEKMRVRREKVVERDQVLRNVESTFFPESFWECSEDINKMSLPTAMWEESINEPPNFCNMELLVEAYPSELIEKFLELLANQKELIAVRTQKRHENIISQMKHDLKQGTEVHKRQYVDIKANYEQLRYILDQLSLAREKFHNARAVRPKTGGTAFAQALKRLQTDIEKSMSNNEGYADRGSRLSAEIAEMRRQRTQMVAENEQTIRRSEGVCDRLRTDIETLRSNIKEMNVMFEQKQREINQMLENEDELVSRDQRKGPCGSKKCKKSVYRKK